MNELAGWEAVSSAGRVRTLWCVGSAGMGEFGVMKSNRRASMTMNIAFVCVGANVQVGSSGEQELNAVRECRESRNPRVNR